MFIIPMLLACNAALKRINELFLWGEPHLWPIGHPWYALSRLTCKHKFFLSTNRLLSVSGALFQIFQLHAKAAKRLLLLHLLGPDGLGSHLLPLWRGARFSGQNLPSSLPVRAILCHSLKYSTKLLKAILMAHGTWSQTAPWPPCPSSAGHSSSTSRSHFPACPPPQDCDSDYHTRWSPSPGFLFICLLNSYPFSRSLLKHHLFSDIYKG